MVISESDSQEEHSEENQDLGLIANKKSDEFFLFFLDENNETPVLTGHTTPGVVSSIVSSEALQADLQGDLRALQNQEEILPVQGERSSPQEVEYFGNEGGLQTREDHNEEHEDIQITHEDNNANEMLDPYWTSQTGK